MCTSASVSLLLCSVAVCDGRASLARATAPLPGRKRHHTRRAWRGGWSRRLPPPSQGARLGTRRAAHMARMLVGHAAGRPAVALAVASRCSTGNVRNSLHRHVHELVHRCAAAMLPGHLWSSGYDVSLTR